MLLSATCGRPDVTEACWREYRRNLYLDDRSFDSAREISSTGSLALAHMTAADLPSEHRKAIYERYMLKERLSIVISESREEVLAVNFYRYSGESSFTDGETASISRIAPYLIAAIKRNASIKSKTPKSENSSVSVDSLIRNHCPELTDREIQVCAYMVQGLTFDGIAASLNLSPATVKTYRDRAFQRMGIHHRNELFGICIALVDGKHIR
jgi:DNA-binding NarL/FixJ family response regulator